MTLNLASLNVRELRNQASVSACLEYTQTSVQETYFCCAEDNRVLERDFVVFQYSVAVAALGSLC